jgi:hypothetical protein
VTCVRVYYSKMAEVVHNKKLLICFFHEFKHYITKLIHACGQYQDPEMKGFGRCFHKEVQVQYVCGFKMFQ